VNEEWFRYLVAAVQLMLTGEAKVEDGVLRIPADIIDGENDGQAVSINKEKEPGTIIFSMTTVEVPEPLAQPAPEPSDV
jgi:hypothetical protein